MHSWTLALVFVVFASGTTTSAQDPKPTPPKAAPPKEEPAKEWKVGEAVPDVTLKGSDGKDHRLRDLTGKRALVIAWFPKAFTGG